MSEAYTEQTMWLAADTPEDAEGAWLWEHEEDAETYAHDMGWTHIYTVTVRVDFSTLKLVKLV